MKIKYIHAVLVLMAVIIGLHTMHAAGLGKETKATTEEPTSVPTGWTAPSVPADAVESSLSPVLSIKSSTTKTEGSSQTSKKVDNQEIELKEEEETATAINGVASIFLSLVGLGALIFMCTLFKR